MSVEGVIVNVVSSETTFSGIVIPASPLKDQLSVFVQFLDDEACKGGINITFFNNPAHVECLKIIAH